MNIKMLRMGLWSLVLIFVLIGGAAFFLVRMPGANAGALGAGDYQLTDARTGATVNQASFTGAPSLVFFGFTHCPEVCPTSLAEMTSWFEELGPQAENLNAYFITVDPERDTAEVLGDYVGTVTDDVTPVTGSRAEIDKAIAAWKVYAEKIPLDNGDYTMDHTASVFLIGADGQFQSTISYGEQRQYAMDKLRRLVAG